MGAQQLAQVMFQHRIEGVVSPVIQFQATRSKRNDVALQGVPSSDRKTTVIAPDKHSATIFDLRPNSVNYAQISVSNGQNDGAPSAPISFRLKEGVPTPVRGLEVLPMNNKHENEKAVVIVRWKKPIHSNGKLTGYTVESCLVNTNGQMTPRDSCPRRSVLSVFLLPLL
ncbi:unnamed protein product [Toxocara canis]|uniref:Fibronectin type-III domain-containing protein n=1 Tax=Toxocara canis TaxID=6265 RepID=A0A183U0V8_TOXCA|nr:unnamed protein product [Toxocara canis]